MPIERLRRELILLLLIVASLVVTIVRKWQLLTDQPGLVTLASLLAVIAILILFWVRLRRVGSTEELRLVSRLFLYTVILTFLLNAALYRALPTHGRTAG